MMREVLRHRVAITAEAGEKTSETVIQKIFANWRCHEIGRKSDQPPAPITGTTFQVHHGHNPDVFRLFHEDDCVGKITAQMPAVKWIEFPKAFRVGASFLDEPFDFTMEPVSQ